ncbi:MAG: phage tail tip lysozyme [Caulobacteraceae bacterium]
MATVIDALVVTLGLDPAAFTRGRKQASAEQDQLSRDVRRTETEIVEIKRRSTSATAAEDAKRIKILKERQSAQKRQMQDNAKEAKDEENYRKKQADGLDKVRGAAIGLIAVFTAGAGIKDFVSSLINGDAATGRLAVNLGLATAQLATYQNLAKQSGGTDADANGSLQSLTTAAQNIQHGVLPGNIGFLQSMGLSLTDLQNIPQALQKIHDRMQTMTSAQQQYMGAGLGFSQSFTNAIADPNYQSNLADASKSVPTDADAARAEAAQKAIVQLTAASRQLGREIFADAAPALTKLAYGLLAVAQWAQQHKPVIIAAFTGIAVAAAALTIALAPEAAAFLAIAAAVGAFSAAIGGLVGWLGKLEGKRKTLDVLDDAINWVHDKATGGNWAQLQAQERARQAAGGGGPPAPVGAGGGVASTLTAAFRAAGYSDVATRGVLAGVTAEGGLRGPNVTNPTSGAYGIGQWLGSRQKDFARVMGHDIHGSTTAEQVKFLLWELANTEKRGGARIRGARTSIEASQAYIGGVMRPGPGYAGDMRRAQAALGGAPVTIGQVTIVTQATNATQMAREVGPKLAQYTKVAQAQSGPS